MPFQTEDYHIGVWKGMEGHREGNGHKLEEGPSLIQWRLSLIQWRLCGKVEESETSSLNRQRPEDAATKYATGEYHKKM